MPALQLTNQTVNIGKIRYFYVDMYDHETAIEVTVPIVQGNSGDILDLADTMALAWAEDITTSPTTYTLTRTLLGEFTSSGTVIS